jgi:tetratricopeptide (TPR) repeat protein
VAVSLPDAAAMAEGAAWWNLNWSYRREVDIAGYQPTGLPADDIAVVTMPTAGRVKGDGGDVRVASARGVERPCRVLMVGPGDVVRVAFAIRAGETKYYVYCGNAGPPKQAAKLDIRRGVLLETWSYTGGGTATLEQARRILFERSNPFVGADFLDRIFTGHNPFGPEDRVASVFTAWLVCPGDGTYTFVCSSMNASFLLIDDGLVVDNGGWHKPQRDISKSGRVTLKAGLHKLTMYHISGGGGDPIVVAAWMPPGKERVEVIPPGAFARVVKAVPGSMRQRDHQVGADFLYDHAGETFLADRYYHRYTFRALPVGKVGRDAKWTWDFGDGQKVAGQEVEHVYLVDGDYTVTLAAQTSEGDFTQANRIRVGRPWGRITRIEQDAVGSHARIVARYDFSAGSARAVAEAVLLLSRVGNDEAVVRAGKAFVAREDITDDAAGEVMPAYVAALGRRKQSREAVGALLKTAEKVKSPAVAASLLVRAGRLLLDDVGDAKEAMSVFDKALTRYAHLTTAPAIRSARIGVGDAWRVLGDRAKAAEAYNEAGRGKNTSGANDVIARGNHARYAEDMTRRGNFAEAREQLDEWDNAFPADRLEGYSTLLRVRLLMAEKEYARAAREAEILVGVNGLSNYAAPLLALASEAYRNLRRPDEAAAALRRIVSEYPESPLASEAAKQLAKP